MKKQPIQFNIRIRNSEWHNGSIIMALDLKTKAFTISFDYKRLCNIMGGNATFFPIKQIQTDYQ